MEVKITECPRVNIMVDNKPLSTPDSQLEHRHKFSVDIFSMGPLPDYKKKKIDQLLSELKNKITSL